MIQVIIALLAFAWLFHGLALLSALLSKPRAGSRGAVGAVVFLFIICSWIVSGIFGIMGRTGTLVDLDQRLTFFGISLPWLAVVLIYIAAVLFYVYLAARRRISSERMHPLSKAQALAWMLTLSILLVGGIWQQDSYDVMQVVALYFLVGASIFAILTATPSQSEYVKGLLRATKRGETHLSAWDDLSLNRVFLATLGAIVLVTGTIIWRAAVAAPMALPQGAISNYPMGVALCVLVVAYFGLAMQYFLLRFGSRGKMYFGLFLFMAWLLPLVGGTIVLMASMPMNRSSAGQVIYSLSPIAGIGTSSAGGNDEATAKLMQGAAITPALLFAFVFNSLLIGARRRLHREFMARADIKVSAAAVKPQSPVFDSV